MRAVIQRVTQASCTVDGQVTGAIDAGLLVLLGVGPDDMIATAKQMATKIANLRIFNDDAGKMNRSVIDIGGAVLSISQFTLYADTSRGNRPSYARAAAPDMARFLYHEFNDALRGCGLRVEEGVFGAHMVIALVNDGPVTITLEAGVRE